MPVKDGFNAAREIRSYERMETGRHVPIIALTASAISESRDKCLNVGMNAFISKPFEDDDLLETIQHWLPDESPPPSEQPT